MNITSIWQYGFGVNAEMIASDLPGSLSSISRAETTALLANVFIANSPQVMASLLYILYNSILTRQLVADEWVRFLSKDGKKALRVSSPRGMQRSTHFLSLPFKYSVPLAMVSILLHWLISQSMFLVQSSGFSAGPDSQRLELCDYSARGYSVAGSILAIAVGLVALAMLLLISVFRYYHDIPVGFQHMAFHSMAIQMFCQRPPDDSDAGFFPVRIGISTDTEASVLQGWPQVVFSTDTKLRIPKNGEQYIQPVLIEEVSLWRRLVTFSRETITQVYLVAKDLWNYLASSLGFKRNPDSPES